MPRQRRHQAVAPNANRPRLVTMTTEEIPSTAGARRLVTRIAAIAEATDEDVA
jgi:hypothetical protein